MKKSSEYLEHAEECQRMASRTQNPEHRAMLMRMAETWANLARERKTHVERQQRIAALEAGQELPQKATD